MRQIKDNINSAAIDRLVVSEAAEYKSGDIPALRGSTTANTAGKSAPWATNHKSYMHSA